MSKTEEEKLKRKGMSNYNPAMALDGSFMRGTGAETVQSWQPTANAEGTTIPQKNLSQQALDSYADKVQSLYDYEAQQRAQADANFQRSLRYLPEQFKKAGLYGSGQSETLLGQMNTNYANTQNAITSDTNRNVMDLKDQYNADVENLNEQTQTQVDEVANYISNVDWSTRSKEEWDNFINYLKSADYSDDVINKAISQIKAFNPDAGHQIGLLDNAYASESTVKSLGTEKERTTSKNFKFNSDYDKIGWGVSFSVTYNGVPYERAAKKAVNSEKQKELNDFAKGNGLEIKTGTVIYKDGEIYVYSGQKDKGWRYTDYVNNTKDTLKIAIN